MHSRLDMGLRFGQARIRMCFAPFVAKRIMLVEPVVQPPASNSQTSQKIDSELAFGRSASVAISMPR